MEGRRPGNGGRAFGPHGVGTGNVIAGGFGGPVFAPAGRAHSGAVHVGGPDVGSGQGGAAAWSLRTPSALSGLRERVRSSFSVERNGRARQRMIAKATDAERAALKDEDWRRVVAEVWQAGESRWVLQRVRERPVASDHVVAFKAVQLLHRVLQHGPQDVVSAWTYPNHVIDGLAAHWGASSRGARLTQPQHCMQAVTEYARVIGAKMELMAEKEAGRMCFLGNLLCDPMPADASDLLQALAMLLNFAEKLMPLALHLVAPTVDVWRLERSQYIRLYLGGIAALLDESWLLLCAISLFVKDLLCQVHFARVHAPGDDGEHRPPWLQLSLHLLAAKPRFTWFHASVCDFVAHCHQLRGSHAELDTIIPKVPEGLLNLFADLGALVQSSKPAEGKASQKPEASISSISTAAGSTPVPSDPSGLESQQASVGTPARQPPPQQQQKQQYQKQQAAAVGRKQQTQQSTQQAQQQKPQKQAFQQPQSQMQPSQQQEQAHQQLPASWEPSPCVLDALRTVDSLQRVPLYNDAASSPTGDPSVTTAAANVRAASPDRIEGPQILLWRGDDVVNGRSPSAPAPSRPRPLDAQGGGSKSRPAKRVQNRERGRLVPPEPSTQRAYELLDDEASSRGASRSPEDTRSASPILGRHAESAASLSPMSARHSAAASRATADATFAAEPSQGGSPRTMPLAEIHLWPPGPPIGDSAALANAGDAATSPAGASSACGCGRGHAAWPPMRNAVEQPTPWSVDAGMGGGGTPTPTPPSWAAAICQSNTHRSGGSDEGLGGAGRAPAHQPLFGAPLWQNQEAVQQPTPQRSAPSRPGASGPTETTGAVQGQAPGQLGQRGPPLPQQRATIPLNPFDLTATQLQRTMRRGDPWEQVEGVSPSGASGASPTAAGVPTPGCPEQAPAPQLGEMEAATRGFARAGPPGVSPSPYPAAASRAPAYGAPPAPAPPPTRQASQSLAAPPTLPIPAAGCGGGTAASPAAALRGALPGHNSPQRGRDSSPRQHQQHPQQHPLFRQPGGVAQFPRGSSQEKPPADARPRHLQHHRRPSDRGDREVSPALGGGGASPSGPSCGAVIGGEWEVDPNELRFEELLGTGSTAEVFRGSWHGTDVAVKRLRRSGPLSVEFTRELSVLLRLRHPNLVLFMGASTQVAPPLIVSEFCAGGTVFQLLHQRRDTVLPWSQRLKIAIDVAKGMNFLHRRQVVHRDLKSLNLLLASPILGGEDVPQVKVSDFGLSRACTATEQSKSQAFMTSGAGTYHWMAPEVLGGNSYDEKVDVYSYGICLYELIARRIPFDTSGLEPVSIAVAVSRGRRPDLACLPRDCPADLRFTMECCWAHCPTGRPGFDTILETLKLAQCL